MTCMVIYLQSRFLPPRRNFAGEKSPETAVSGTQLCWVPFGLTFPTYLSLTCRYLLGDSHGILALTGDPSERRLMRRRRADVETQRQKERWVERGRTGSRWGAPGGPGRSASRACPVRVVPVGLGVRERRRGSLRPSSCELLTWTGLSLTFAYVAPSFFES